METFVPKGNIYGPILPQFVLQKSITFGAKTMYALLCDYAADKDHCWPSQATLAKRLSCSISSIKNYLAELVREKLISVKREQYRSSVYYILRPEDFSAKQETNLAHKQSKFDCHAAKSGYLTNLNNQRKEKNPPFPPLRLFRHGLGLFATFQPRLRRGVCLLPFWTLKAPGISTPKRTPRALPAWPGSSSCEMANFLPWMKSERQSGDSRTRKAGNANRAVLCRKWATGCVGNVGLILFRPPSRRNSGTVGSCIRQSRHGKNRNGENKNSNERKKNACGPCLTLSRRSFRPLPTTR